MTVYFQQKFYEVGIKLTSPGIFLEKCSSHVTRLNPLTIDVAAMIASGSLSRVVRRNAMVFFNYRIINW